MEKDVTGKVNFSFPDDESLPITKCVCGRTFGLWNFIINMDKESPVECPECGRKLYFESEIRVYEITED